MKSKIMVLGICAILTACGLGKGDRNHQSGKNENALEVLLLKNLKVQSIASLQQVSSGNQFHYLGSFDTSSVPEEIRRLATESEIGTLSVEFEDEVYAEKYSGDVCPVLKKRQENIRASVYLLKDTESPQRISLAIKDDELSKKVNLREESHPVNSSPREYCNQTHITFSQGSGASVPEQIANCDPHQNCVVMVNVEARAPFKGGVMTRNIVGVESEIERTCISHLTHYYVSETKVNRFVPKAATIVLDAGIASGLKKIKFDL